MWDLSRIYELHHSSRQHQMLNPLSEARDRAHIVMDTRWVRFPSTKTETPQDPCLTSSQVMLFLDHTLNIKIPEPFVIAGGSSLVLSLLTLSPRHQSWKCAWNWYKLRIFGNGRGARFSTCVSMDFSLPSFVAENKVALAPLDEKSKQWHQIHRAQRCRLRFSGKLGS